MKTSPEVRSRVVELVRSGETRMAVARDVGISARTVSEIVKATPGVEFARTGQGSSGTPEAMAKARGVMSEYARHRRAKLADRIMDEAERILDQLGATLPPRDRLALNQALAANGKGYESYTTLEAKAAPDMEYAKGLIVTFSEAAAQVSLVLGAPRPGLIQE
ncbi:helix-turn-helix domain-containing protein [Microbacterium sp. 22296]|uniref:helix-turn-helix domain-containing protein n=1 Tax=Microbacterium sp. 22296 TaxID=3453903 RepID=UPI003F82E39E